MPSLRGKRVLVLVQGDLGRSPRMSNHALALAVHGADVTLVGFDATPVSSTVRDTPNLRVVAMPELRLRDHVSAPLFAPSMAVDFAAVTAAFTDVLRRHPADLYLTQVPPGAPLPWLAAAAAKLRGAPFLVDWHNLGRGQLAAARGGSRLPSVLHRVERALSRRATAHLCVSDVFRQALEAEFDASPVTVLRDLPPARFFEARHAPLTLQELQRDLQLPQHIFSPPHAPRSSAQQRNGTEPASPVSSSPVSPTVVGSPQSEPPYVLAPTSFTPDEDLEPLLAALPLLNAAAQRQDKHVVVLVSGKGPGHDVFHEKTQRQALSHVHLRTLWVSADEYPRLVAGAALGLSLHRSSSGFDIPIKVSESLGAGVPVCALDYGAAIREVVQEGQNGVLFQGPPQLAAQLETLLLAKPQRLRTLREHLSRTPPASWESAWETSALPLIARLLSQ